MATQTSMTERKRVIDVMQKILGDDFKYKWIMEHPYSEATSGIYTFLYRPKKSIDKDAIRQVIKQKVVELESPESQQLLGYGDVEEYKIDGIGQIMILTTKSIDLYKSEINTYRSDIRALKEKIKLAQGKIALLEQKK